VHVVIAMSRRCHTQRHIHRATILHRDRNVLTHLIGLAAHTKVTAAVIWKLRRTCVKTSARELRRSEAIARTIATARLTLATTITIATIDTEAVRTDAHVIQCQAVALIAYSTTRTTIRATVVRIGWRTQARIYNCTWRRWRRACLRVVVRLVRV